jgi:transposase
MTAGKCDSLGLYDIEALKAALLAERAARREFEARASGAEAMVAHLKLLIAKMKRDRFGASAERGRKLLDQLEMQLEELETAAAEDEVAAATAAPDTTTVRPFTRARPVRAPLPAHLPRERVVLPSPANCPCCGGTLSKLGETITETLESIPRSYTVIQTVREKFSCRSCETITQPPGPFHVIARGRAGPDLLATILHAKFGEHQPLNRQSERFFREGIDLSVSTLADWVGACTTVLSPLVTLIQAHVLAAERLHGDETTVPVLAKDKTPSPADYGPMCATTNRSAVRRRRRRSSTTRAIALVSIRAAISRATPAFSKPTPMPGSTSSTTPHANPVRSLRPGVGRTGNASCSCWPMSPRRRWRSRRCAGSMQSSISSATSTVCLRLTGRRCARSAPPLWSPAWRPGCAANAASYRGMPMSRRPWTTCSSAGMCSRGSWMTAEFA